MKDKDKEAFNNFFSDILKNMDSIWHEPFELEYKNAMIDAFKAACEYMQKEIDEFRLELELVDSITVRNVLKDNKKLQVENKKLREALERFIFAHEVGGCKTEYSGAFKDAREALKEVDE